MINSSHSEIEKELIGKGDFVQINYLENLLNKELALDSRKFVCLKLADIYVKKSMISDAAKMHNNAAIASVAFTEKIKHHVKEAELYIKAGFFDRADEATKKAMTEASSSQKDDIYFAINQFYKRQADIYIEERKNNNAARIYEKVLEMNISNLEREDIKKKLLNLYEKLGRIQDYSKLLNNQNAS